MSEVPYRKPNHEAIRPEPEAGYTADIADGDGPARRAVMIYKPRRCMGIRRPSSESKTRVLAPKAQAKLRSWSAEDAGIRNVSRCPYHAH